MTNLQKLIAEIKMAFPLDYPSEVDAALRTWTPHPEEQEARQLFLGKKWDEIPDEILFANCPSPFFIGAVPRLYYLPTFLIAALCHPEEELMGVMVEFRLKPPKKPEKLVEFADEFSGLSVPQRSAVASFLFHARDHIYNSESEYDRRVRRRINDAIERCWGQKTE